MDMLLGALAFAAIILVQYAAIVGVHGARERREPETSVLPHLDHRARLIWHGN